MAMAIIELTSEMVSSLSSKCKKDRKLAEVVAKELFSQSDAIRIVKLVLSKEKALSLLVDYIQDDLEYVVDYLKGKRGLKRRRISYERIVDIKDNVCKFLKYHPGSSRLEILASVTTCGIYRRIMGELVKDGLVKRVGDKRNAVYYLHGNGASS